MNTKTMIICAIFAAVLCVFSVMTIPISPVPISMGIFGIMLTASILGAKKGSIAVIIYILLGAIGLPVFSGFKGGIQVLAGPTGGYIWSYIFMAIIIGLLTAKLATKPILAMVQIFGACVLGTAVCYFFGTVQFMLVQNMGLIKSLSLCVFPFVAFDLLKAVVCAYLAYTIRKALLKANLL